jgi:alkylhydroperoxidase/carboxymuconolactone decarboxylase family protein YurZ
MSVRTDEAKKEGVSKDEIVQTLLITSQMVGSSLLQIAYKSMGKQINNE